MLCKRFVSQCFFLFIFQSMELEAWELGNMGTHFTDSQKEQTCRLTHSSGWMMYILFENKLRKLQEHLMLDILYHVAKGYNLEVGESKSKALKAHGEIYGCDI